MEAARLGQRIRELREWSGLSQAQVGASLGLHLVRIREYESGKRRIRSATLARLGEVLGVSVTEFFASPGEGRKKVKPDLVKAGLAPSPKLIKALKNPEFLRLMERSARAAQFHKKNLKGMNEALGRLRIGP